jgi:hypothetical protein
VQFSDAPVSVGTISTDADPVLECCDVVPVSILSMTEVRRCCLLSYADVNSSRLWVGCTSQSTYHSNGWSSWFTRCLT